MSKFKAAGPIGTSIGGILLLSSVNSVASGDMSHEEFAYNAATYFGALGVTFFLGPGYGLAVSIGAYGGSQAINGLNELERMTNVRADNYIDSKSAEFQKMFLRRR